MEPLISVGIPTYNRADGLKTALDCITRQTYRNLDIVVSDNASPNDQTEQIVRGFMKGDRRIRFFRHPENKGSAFNFNFVMQQAASDLFMWAADDDKWDSANLIEELSRYALSHTLTFPDCNLSSRNRIFERSHLALYKDCATPNDYLRRWCGHGTGYPFYGLYNRKKMKEENLAFVFDSDLAYYNEGTFLHRMFLNGNVKFVPGVYITFSVDSSKPDMERLVADFKKYFARTMLLYGKSRLDAAETEAVCSIIIDTYTRHLMSLQLTSGRGKVLRKTARELKSLFRR